MFISKTHFCVINYLDDILMLRILFLYIKFQWIFTKISTDRIYFPFKNVHSWLFFDTKYRLSYKNWFHINEVYITPYVSCLCVLNCLQNKFYHMFRLVCSQDSFVYGCSSNMRMTATFYCTPPTVGNPLTSLQSFTL